MSELCAHLRRVVSARLDRRLSARVDPSDVVQEALTAASRMLPQYLIDRPLPFRAWLKKLAVHRVSWWHRAHLGSAKRTVLRESQAIRLPSADSMVMGTAFSRLLLFRLPGSLRTCGHRLPTTSFQACMM